MNPAIIIQQVTADGVRLALSSTGTIKATGEQTAVARWLPVIRENKPGIVAVLQGAANDATPEPTEQFIFTPPNDPANDDEALRERAAIMGVENGWNDATALLEARWQADRERCWRTFLSNAERVLARPEREHKALLRRYEDEATRRYGKDTGACMAHELAAWIRTQAVQ